MKKLKYCIKIFIFLLINTNLIVDCQVVNGPSSNEKSKDQVINRVDLPDDKKETVFSIAYLNDTHENLSVKWLGKGSSVMIILAKNQNKNNSSRTTNMYISYDYGHEFKKEERLKVKDNSSAILHTFITSKVKSSNFLFTDIINNYLFISEDFGKSYETVALEFTPKNVQMHSSISNYIIASDDQDPTTLYLSQDFGRHWKSIAKNVSKASWANFHNKDKERVKDRIYAMITQPNGSKIIKYSDDYFATTSDPDKSEDDIKDFKICGNYITFTSFNNKRSAKKEKYVTLHVSSNNSIFLAATHNQRGLDATDYIIVDCSDSELIIAVRFNDSTNYNLFISNQAGFKLRRVLDNIMVNNKTRIPDIHKVAGLTGVYIANAYEGKSNATLISYDSGYSWTKINLSQVQSDELINSKCTSEKCSLHFPQNTVSNSFKYPGIISKESAVGIIIANGVIDEHLKNDTKQVLQTYISRDAGRNWRKITDGEYLFNIGDFGALIVGVKHFPKSSSTKTLIYSLDDGKTFNELQFINEPMKVYSLLTENGEKTSVFTIFGSMEKAQHSWVLVKVNLTSYFNRKCEKDDFEYWKPNNLNPKACMMGVQMNVLRRKENVNCSHGEEFERKTKPTLCECTRDDYICDYGFQENENRLCIPIDIEDLLPDCDPKDFTRTIIGGYYKIPGNQCIPPKDSHYENTRHISCTSKSNRQVFKTIFISLILTIAVFGAGYIGLNYFRNRQTRSTLLNTHYNRRTDSAILLDDDGLGEEVHVRGFSDDVPMVIS